jgi:hypothetical protein
MSGIEGHKRYKYDNDNDYYDNHEGFKSNSLSLTVMKDALARSDITKENHSNYLQLYNRVHGKEGGGSLRNKATPKSKSKPKHEDMTMKDIKEMCKANQIKLSKVVEGKRVVYKKKELITKLKRKKLL